MPDDELSSQAQDYLKTIWSMQEWTSEEVTASAVAARAGVRRSTVSDALRRLGERGLVDHARYGTVSLTEPGRREAVRLVRRHRILETYLVRVLGYGWHEVHEEADRLEHAASDGLIARMESQLDHPGTDPHGDRIPRECETRHRHDELAVHGSLGLDEVASGSLVEVLRVSDADPGALQHFAEHGLVPGALLRVHRTPWAEDLSLEVQDGHSLGLGSRTASLVRVRVMP